MAFSLESEKLGFKLGEVLVGLKSGTTDTPETLASSQNKLHILGYVWNTDSLSYEVLTKSGGGLDVNVVGQSTDEATRLVYASATVSYLGKAPAGTATSSAAWKISRITTSGDNVTIEWADGNTNYDNIYDNRASLSYS